MDTLIIGNRSRREIRDSIVAAWKTGKAEHAARVDFPDTSVAWKVLSDNRRAIIQAMAGEGALSTREVAARVGRDVHPVHNDITTLHDAGVIDRIDDGWILPYKTIKLELVINVQVQETGNAVDTVAGEVRPSGKREVASAGGLSRRR